MTELFAIRHGETEWNIQHRFQGQRNSPLTAHGKAQALAKQAAFARLRFDALYSSDLPRALETAALLFPDRKVESTPLLRELAMGALEGLPIDDPGEHAELARTLFRQPEAFVPTEATESIPQLMARVQRFLTLVAERHSNQRVAAISHGGAIRALWTVVAEQPPAALWQGPAIHNLEAMRFTHEEGRWRYLPEGEG